LPFIFLLPVAYLTFELWVIRPQVFSYLLAAILLFILDRGRPLAFVPVVILLWANMHAGVVLGFCIVFVFAITRTVADPQSWRRHSLLTLAAFVAVLCNPNGLGILTYSSLIAPAAQELHVVEWESILRHMSSWQAAVFLSMIAAAAMGYGAYFFRDRRRWRDHLFDTAILLMGIVLPLISIRHVGFFPLLALPLITQAASLKRPVLDRDRLAPVIVLAVTAILATFALVRLSRQPVADEHILPLGAVSFIREQGIGGPLFEVPAHGGTVIFGLWPRERVFIDGRNEVYLKQVNHDFLAMIRQDEGWKDIAFKKYRFRAFLLPHLGALRDASAALTASLMREFGFRLVYWDDAAILLVADDSANADLIRKFSFLAINPFVPPGSIPEDVRPLARREAEWAIRRTPEAVTVREYAESL
jgi:hypothetical protein